MAKFEFHSLLHNDDVGCLRAVPLKEWKRKKIKNKIKNFTGKLSFTIRAVTAFGSDLLGFFFEHLHFQVRRGRLFCSVPEDEEDDPSFEASDRCVPLRRWKPARLPEQSSRAGARKQSVSGPCSVSSFHNSKNSDCSFSFLKICLVAEKVRRIKCRKKWRRRRLAWMMIVYT